MRRGINVSNVIKVFGVTAAICSAASFAEANDGSLCSQCCSGSGQGVCRGAGG